MGLLTFLNPSNTNKRTFYQRTVHTNSAFLCVDNMLIDIIIALNCDMLYIVFPPEEMMHLWFSCFPKLS